MIKSVIWSSMVDYPDNVCTTLFTGGCNFNCEYCYNKNLLNENTLSFKGEILPKLLERKEFVNHVIISGGECTISSDFFEIVNELYEKDFIIGIHTNGYEPEILQKIIWKLSFVGMDIKNDFDHYDKISRSKNRDRKNKKVN